jgi:hypothetical protein
MLVLVEAAPARKTQSAPRPGGGEEIGESLTGVGKKHDPKARRDQIKGAGLEPMGLGIGLD